MGLPILAGMIQEQSSGMRIHLNFQLRRNGSTVKSSVTLLVSPATHTTDLGDLGLHRPDGSTQDARWTSIHASHSCPKHIGTGEEAAEGYELSDSWVPPYLTASWG